MTVGISHADPIMILVITVTGNIAQSVYHTDEVADFIDAIDKPDILGRYTLSVELL
jgi:hypothetical protein